MQFGKRGEGRATEKRFFCFKCARTAFPLQKETGNMNPASVMRRNESLPNYA
jgi:hypothetical protein